jgi:hypothetical protein
MEDLAHVFEVLNRYIVDQSTQEVYGDIARLMECNRRVWLVSSI